MKELRFLERPELCVCVCVDTSTSPEEDPCKIYMIRFQAIGGGIMDMKSLDEFCSDGDAQGNFPAAEIWRCKRGSLILQQR